MKITVRIERDKTHFIKRTFSSLDQMEYFIMQAKMSQTKAILKSWYRQVCMDEAQEGDTK